ncbi:MAG TPA: NTP transferase domain-containing protein [Pyrinomonadaceae bacterium]|nr:NTP transferase domain-containing protein [Pyrinomonadaceae bacterium]
MSSQSITVGVVPVGGKGTRLSKHNPSHTPKVLYKLEGVEILCYSLLSLKYAGCKQVICLTSDATHHDVEKFLITSALGIDLRAVNAQAEGTAGALAFLGTVSDDFYYTNGDIIFHPAILLELLNRHQSGDHIATVSASPSNVAPTHPHFTCDDHSGLKQVQLWPNTSPNSLCSLETAVFRPDIFDYLQQLSGGALTMEALALARKDGAEVSVLRTNRPWYHLAEPSDLEKFIEFKKALVVIEQLLGIKKAAS